MNKSLKKIGIIGLLAIGAVMLTAGSAFAETGVKLVITADHGHQHHARRHQEARGRVVITHNRRARRRAANQRWRAEQRRRARLRHERQERREARRRWRRHQRHERREARRQWRRHQRHERHERHEREYRRDRD